MMTLLITGGAGFIGSAVVRHLVGNAGHKVVNLDKLTYAGNLDSLQGFLDHPQHQFKHADVQDRDVLRHLFSEHQPDAVMHLAAESHVDRSIDSPGNFIDTNIQGTFSLLEEARRYWGTLPRERRRAFRFHHVSTDEVYGSLGQEGLFNESSPYKPNSPYAASKAASDHLVRAWYSTYGMPIVVSNCSNNYGPRQFPEKLIPHMVLNALSGKPLPIYGDGKQIRDWLYVDDHARALEQVLLRGNPGETYNIGGNNERRNLDVVHSLCDLLEAQAPDRKPAGLDHYRSLITFVTDRPGHDVRYAIDASKITSELGWTPSETFESGLAKTVRWYLTNEAWWQRVLSGDYRLTRLGAAS